MSDRTRGKGEREDTDPATGRRADDGGGLSRRGVLWAGGAALATAPAVVSSASAPRDASPAGPAGVHAAYGADPRTTVNVGWSGDPAAEAYVEYGRQGTGLRARSRGTARPVPGERSTSYAASLVDLAPGTTYEYRVVMDGRTSDRFAVSTAPPSHASGGGFRVTAVGDHGVADPDNPFQRPDSEDPVDVLDVVGDPERGVDLHLGVGDISYANGHPSTWELYFDTFEDVYASTPFMTVPGNHEAEPGTGLTQYDRRLNDLMPVDDPPPNVRNSQRWYDFEFGNALFVGLNTTTDECGGVARSEEFVPIYDVRCQTEEGYTYGEAQARYLEETLAAAADDPRITWTVVYFHGPLWTTAPNHPSRADLLARWGALFDEYGVDLVLSGDNHVYERTYPIADERRSTYGTTYVTNGTGGTSHYELAEPDHPEVWARRTNEHFGVTQLDGTDEELRVRYVDQDGTVRDDFAIRKGTVDGETRPYQVQDP